MNEQQLEIRRIEKVMALQEKNKRKILTVTVILLVAIVLLGVELVNREKVADLNNEIINKQYKKIETQQVTINYLREQNEALEQDLNARSLKAKPITLNYTNEVKNDVLENDFLYYDIPATYKNTGGSLPEEIQKHIFKLCTKYKVDYTVILGMIETETSYNKDAISSAGAVGYMQIIPKYHLDRIKELGGAEKDIKDPYLNISVGIDYIAKLQDKYGDIDKALTAYCYGEAGAKKHIFDKGLDSSDYSSKVLEKASRIKEELGGVNK